MLGPFSKIMVLSLLLGSMSSPDMVSEFPPVDQVLNSIRNKLVTSTAFMPVLYLRTYLARLVVVIDLRG